jgi:uncharacterized membrane protein
MNRLFLGGALGALAMYFLDPQSGRRRRARTRDQVAHAARVAGEAGKVTARDTAQRAQGVWAEAKKLFRDDDVSDEALVGRVRAALGRVVSHPHAIEAFVDRGHVDLSGAILADEVRALLACVRRITGVRGVSDHLAVYPMAAGVPSLQGGVRRGGEHWEFGQDHWAPSARLLAGALGAGLMLRSAHERGLWGALLGAAGGGLLARAVTNFDLASLVGLGERGITVQKVIKVSAPVEEVFAFWTDYQNFPRFMSKVREVQPVAEGRSRWLVAGPAGIPVHWTAEVTRVVPSSLIEWRATGDSEVRHEGSVRFERAVDESAQGAPGRGESATRITVRLSYRPPAGAFGHAVAAMFGADPKTEMDADLMRMKTMIETGRSPHDAARPAPN